MCPSLAEPDLGGFPRRKLPFIGRQRSDSVDSHAVVFPGSRIQLLALKITFSSIHKTHTGTTLSVCVFLFAIFLKNYLTNRKTYAIIKVLCEFFTVRGVTQLGRVLALGARCRRFESCRLDHIVPNILSNPSAGCFFVLQFFLPQPVYRFLHHSSTRANSAPQGAITSLPSAKTMRYA